MARQTDLQDPCVLSLGPMPSGWMQGSWELEQPHTKARAQRVQGQSRSASLTSGLLTRGRSNPLAEATGRRALKSWQLSLLPTSTPGSRTHLPSSPRLRTAPTLGVAPQPAAPKTWRRGGGDRPIIFFGEHSCCSTYRPSLQNQAQHASCCFSTWKRGNDEPLPTAP